MRRLIPILVILGAFVASSCDATTPYAAIVNGTRISRSEVNHELGGLSGNAAFVQAYDQSQQTRPGVFAPNTAGRAYTQSFAAAVLGLDIQAAVVHAEVVRRHIEPPPGTIDSPATASAAAQQFGTDVYGKFAAWVRHLFQLRQAEEDALGKALAPQGVTDAQVQQFYDANPTDFIATQCVSHILLKSQGDANTVMSQLQAGASFAAVAAQSSTDAATASTGGALGCLPPGQGTNPTDSDTAFVSAATNAKLNTVTGPVQTTEGWDVLIVTQRTVTPLNDQVKQAIRQQLQQQAQPLASFFQAAAKTLKVQVNPTYGHWDTQQLTVVAPNSPDPVKSGLPAAPAPVAPTTTTP